jgi:integrase
MANVDLSQFGLALNLPHISPNSRSFRPPSWPPPKDWVCIEDKNGNPVSRLGDHVLDLSPWSGKKTSFSFGDGPKQHARSVVIDPANADILRDLFVFRTWGPRPALALRSLETVAKWLRQIVAVCSKNHILASDLSRYPAVIDKVAQALPPSTYDNIIAELDRLRDARDILGYELLDRAGIERLKALQPLHDHRQTEYIPPRIWSYVVRRVAECTKDYADHRDAIEACFEFCVDAYKRNGAMEHRKRTGESYRNPFHVSRAKGRRTGILYEGRFADTAQRFGVKNLLEKWVGSISGKRGLRGFTSYFQLTQYAALVDIAAFTLMRIEETSSVRWNCLQWHDDPVFGRIPLIQGETTKTDSDENALWITTPSIEPSIRALQSITRMRLASAGRWVEGENPRLIHGSIEPWGRANEARDSGLNVRTPSLAEVNKKPPFLFEREQLTITEDDLKIARAVCPTLNRDRFQVGKPWALAWHQFRRTGAVNMFASGDISDSTIQLQMKHLTRAQPLYYGRGNTALRLNDATRVLLVNAQYEATARDLVAMHTDRFVSPHGETHKTRLLAPANDGERVNLISEADAKHYERVYREHRIGGRLTVLGACMKNGQCDGDCVTSVGDCAGADDKTPCTHVLFDRARASANQKRLEAVRLQLAQTPPDTARYRYLLQETRGLENYFGHINKAA